MADLPSSNDLPPDLLVFVVGATAAGKKELGLRLARAIGAEVLFMDSVKVYRGLQIGAAMPTADDLSGLRAHLLEIADPDEVFTVGRFVRAAQTAVAEVRARGAIPLFLGGTPLYLQALLRGFFDGPAADPKLRARLDQEADEAGLATLHARLAACDPDAAERIAPADRKRILRALEVFELTGEPISKLQREQTRPALDGEVRMIGLQSGAEVQRERQARRVDRMLELGLVEEVKRLRDAGRLRGEAARSIGYREILAYLDGTCSLDEARLEIINNTRKLDRKQLKWLRRFDEIRWIDRDRCTTPDQVLAEAVAHAARPGDRVDGSREGAWFR